MADETVAHYTFVPWTRRGVSARITEVDSLAAAPTAATERPTLGVELVLDYVTPDGTSPGAKPTIPKTIELLGPGDVIGVKPDALLRTVPFDGELGVAENLLAYAEFYEEDFPWRYTPAKASGDKLRPWIALLVLVEGEFKLVEPPGARPYIEIPAANAAAALPPEQETWAWAHVQVAGVVNAPEDVSGAIYAAPDRSLSRIVCPRKLAPRTEYHAFIVPTFEVGRLAGLGSSTAGVPALAPAWVASAMPHSPERPNQLPVYHRFRFKTGEYGDFESLVRILKAGPAGQEFGKRSLDVSRPGFGLDGASTVTSVALEGALQPIDFERTEFPASPGAAFSDRVEEILDLSENLAGAAPVTMDHPFGFAASVPDDPIITPPAYGKAHAGVLRVADAASDADLAWLRELNLDPRSRAAAGLGVLVVQQRQEELMERAWQQVGDIETANQRLREAELATAVSDRLFQKHVVGAEDNRLLTLTSSLQRTVRTTGAATMEGEFRQSRVAAAARSSTFKRISRPQRKVMRGIFGTGNVAGLQTALIDRMNAEDTTLTAAPPRPDPAGALSYGALASAAEEARSEFQSNATEGKQRFLQILQANIARRLEDPPEDLAALGLGALKTALHTDLDAVIPPGAGGTDGTARAQVVELIDAMASVAADGTTRFTVTIPDALFADRYGSDIDGKTLQGVYVMRAGAPARPIIASATSLDEIQGYIDALGQLETGVLSDAARPPPPPKPALTAVTSLKAGVIASIAPETTILARVKGSVGGLPAPPPSGVRPMRPVMAHPVFGDAEFQDLRKISQDYVIPNFGQLPKDSITLLMSNQRFIESFMAGLNHEMGRELLWREFPTDQRGTYFRKFWDTRDDLSGGAGTDIQPMTSWTGALGSQSGRAGSYLVLVIRGQLLEKYPNTVVYARKARFQRDTSAPRVLSDDTDPNNVLYPAFQGELEPDIALFGFALDAERARGHRPLDAGWFFVLQERPGQLLFGLDDPFDPLPALPLGSWDDLNWGHVQFPASSPNHVALAANAAIAGPAEAAWGRSSADMAHLLLQDPVLFARHAEEMLP